MPMYDMPARAVNKGISPAGPPSGIVDSVSGSGLCLFAKRLEQGTFRWPKIEDGIMRLTSAQLAALLEGLDWTRVQAADVRPSTASIRLWLRNYESTA